MRKSHKQKIEGRKEYRIEGENNIVKTIATMLYWDEKKRKERWDEKKRKKEEEEKEMLNSMRKKNEDYCICLDTLCDKLNTIKSQYGINNLYAVRQIICLEKHGEILCPNYQSWKTKEGVKN